MTKQRFIAAAFIVSVSWACTAHAAIDNSAEEAAASGPRTATFAAEETEAVSVVEVTIRGKVHDSDDWWDQDDEEPFQQSWSLPMTRDGIPVQINHRKCVDNEVELSTFCVLSMDTEHIVHTTCQLQLFEGSYCGEDLVREENHGPVSTAPGQAHAALSGRLADNQGDWAEYTLKVSNPTR